MTRDDTPTLRALGFSDDEIRELGLWEPAAGEPAQLAEAYIRRSKAKDTLSTLRAHLRDIVRAASAEGIAIRHVHFEQRSASKAYVRREEFENATQAILDGRSRTLYVWRTDRLSRRGMGAVDRLIDQFRGARIVVTSEGLDSSKPGMRIIFGILADRAREEAKAIAQRTKTGGDAHKTEGRWPGGVVPYGLRCPKGTGKLEHDPAEYPTARRIAAWLLDGVTPASIANTLNAEGTRTRKSKMWRAQTVIHLAQSPSWAGLIPDRERARDEHGDHIDKWHRGGNPLMAPDGHPVAAGVGVVTYAEWERIRLIISGRSRPGTTIGDRTRGVRRAKTILTGILRCPFCKGAMGNGGRNYRCLARINQGESVCKGAATLRERADEAAAVLWINHIVNLPPDSPTILAIARRWLSYEDPAVEARKQAVTRALDDAVEREAQLRKERFILSRISEADYEYLWGALNAQIESLKAELAEVSAGADLSPLMDPEALIDLWNSAGVDGQRALLSAALRRVTLLPAGGKGDRTPILDRMEPEWLDDDTSHSDAAWEAWERRSSEADSDG
ncbi:recombinase family protein [Streptomyces sp. NPDC015532]|uniref:recombinase family protein n=1 Tax=Streptomyces sp. NPDC015532 TaxID=3364960 RepID=UPI0036FCA3D9